MRLAADRRHVANVRQIDAVDLEGDEVVRGPQPVAGACKAADEFGRDSVDPERRQLARGGPRVTDLLHRIDEIAANAAHR